MMITIIIIIIIIIITIIILLTEAVGERFFWSRLPSAFVCTCMLLRSLNKCQLKSSEARISK